MFKIWQSSSYGSDLLMKHYGCSNEEEISNMGVRS